MASASQQCWFGNLGDTFIGFALHFVMYLGEPTLDWVGPQDLIDLSQRRMACLLSLEAVRDSLGSRRRDWCFHPGLCCSRAEAQKCTSLDGLMHLIAAGRLS